MKKNLKVPAQSILLLAVIILLASGLRYSYRQFYRAAYPIRYSAAVEQYSHRYDLPPSLLYAVMRTESGFNPEAQSNVGAMGLMQITEDTFAWIAYREGESATFLADSYFHEETNIHYGAALLRLHLEEFGSVENALCAYHAGRSNLLNWLNDEELSPDGKTLDTIPFGSTNRYVLKVLETQQKYQILYDMN